MTMKGEVSHENEHDHGTGRRWCGRTNKYWEGNDDDNNGATAARRIRSTTQPPPPHLRGVGVFFFLFIQLVLLPAPRILPGGGFYFILFKFKFILINNC